MATYMYMHLYKKILHLVIVDTAAVLMDWTSIDHIVLTLACVIFVLMLLI